MWNSLTWTCMVVRSGRRFWSRPASSFSCLLIVRAGASYEVELLSGYHLGDLSTRVQHFYSTLATKAWYQRANVYEAISLATTHLNTTELHKLNIPANGLYFVVYESCSDVIKKYTGEPHISVAYSTFAGGLAGMSYWILGMPADVLKSRLQTAPEGTYKYGIRSVFRELMQQDGPLALYRGVTPIMIRAFPANAACFAGITVAETFFRNVFPNF